jgi:hypothetical protein
MIQDDINNAVRVLREYCPDATLIIHCSPQDAPGIAAPPGCHIIADRDVPRRDAVVTPVSDKMSGCRWSQWQALFKWSWAHYPMSWRPGV